VAVGEIPYAVASGEPVSRILTVRNSLRATLVFSLLLFGFWVTWPALKIPLAYMLALLFGALVGGTELVSRYRDKPAAALSNWPAVLYMSVNAIASAVLFFLLHTGRLNIPVDVFANSKILDDLALAGFGAMALLRTSLFTIEVARSSIAIGPAAVLQVILRVADRETDRQRAGPRARRVKDIMRGVSFASASVALTEHCARLMQNVSVEERADLDQEIIALRSRADLSDEAKAYVLGLLLMNIVGEDVLQEAVAALGTRIRNPTEDNPAVLSRAGELEPADIGLLWRFCFALDTRERKEKDVIGMQAELKGLETEGVSGVGLALIVLRTHFGAEIVSMAMGLVISSKTGTRKQSADLSTASFS
jgi:hypothetical protein